MIEYSILDQSVAVAGRPQAQAINETIELGNTDYSNRTQFEIANINEVSKRILTVPTHQVSVLQLSSSNGAGTFSSGSLKYARFTNLDNKNHVRLTFMSQSAGVTKNKAVANPKGNTVNEI